MSTLGTKSKSEELEIVQKAQRGRKASDELKDCLNGTVVQFVVSRTWNRDKVPEICERVWTAVGDTLWRYPANSGEFESWVLAIAEEVVQDYGMGTEVGLSSKNSGTNAVPTERKESVEEVNQLVRDLFEGQRAFEKLINTFGSSVCGRIAIKIGDLEKAKDISQQAWTNAWNFLNSYDPEKSKKGFKPWIDAISKNLFYSSLRHDYGYVEHGDFECDKSNGKTIDSESERDNLVRGNRQYFRLETVFSDITSRKRTSTDRNIEADISGVVSAQDSERERDKAGEKLFSLLELCCVRPHKLIAWAFTKLLSWDKTEEETLGEDLGLATLGSLSNLFCEEYYLERFPRKAGFELFCRELGEGLFRKRLQTRVSYVYPGLESADFAVAGQTFVEDVRLSVFRTGGSQWNTERDRWVHAVKFQLKKAVYGENLLPLRLFGLLASAPVMPHKIVTFGFLKLLEWKREFMIEKLRDLRLEEMAQQFFDYYIAACPGLKEDSRFRRATGGLEAVLNKEAREVYLRELEGWDRALVRDLPFSIFLSNIRQRDLSDWCEFTKEQWAANAAEQMRDGKVSSRLGAELCSLLLYSLAKPHEIILTGLVDLLGMLPEQLDSEYGKSTLRESAETLAEKLEDAFWGDQRKWSLDEGFDFLRERVERRVSDVYQEKEWKGQREEFGEQRLGEIEIRTFCQEERGFEQMVSESVRLARSAWGTEITRRAKRSELWRDRKEKTRSQRSAGLE